MKRSLIVAGLTIGILEFFYWGPNRGMAKMRVEDYS